MPAALSAAHPSGAHAVVHAPPLEAAGSGLPGLADLLQGRLRLPSSEAAQVREVSALTAITAAAALAPGLAVDLFPQHWHICWSGAGLPATALLAVLLGTPVVRAVYRAGGVALSRAQALHAVLAATATAATWSLLGVPLIALAGALGVEACALHMVVAAPVGVGTALGLRCLTRTLPEPAALRRSTQLAASAGLALAGGAAVAALGQCGDPSASWLPTGIPSAVLFSGLWLLGGLFVGGLLRRRGISSAAAALFSWPLLLPLVVSRTATAPAEATEPEGPLATQIHHSFDRLAKTLQVEGGTGAAADPTSCAHAERLRAELLAVDARLAQADRILAEPELILAAERGATSLAASLDELRQRRDHATTEVVEVLDSVHELRVQAGILGLAERRAPVRQRLDGLRARVAALREVDLQA